MGQVLSLSWRFERSGSGKLAPPSGCEGGSQIQCCGGAGPSRRRRSRRCLISPHCAAFRGAGSTRLTSSQRRPLPSLPYATWSRTRSPGRSRHARNHGTRTWGPLSSSRSTRGCGAERSSGSSGTGWTWPPRASLSTARKVWQATGIPINTAMYDARIALAPDPQRLEAPVQEGRTGAGWDRVRTAFELALRRRRFQDFTFHDLRAPCVPCRDAGSVAGRAEGVARAFHPDRDPPLRRPVSDPPPGGRGSLDGLDLTEAPHHRRAGHPGKPGT